eukprot:gene10035-19987_t
MACFTPSLTSKVATMSSSDASSAPFTQDEFQREIAKQRETEEQAAGARRRALDEQAEQLTRQLQLAANATAEEREELKRQRAEVDKQPEERRKKEEKEKKPPSPQPPGPQAVRPRREQPAARFTRCAHGVTVKEGG